MRDRIVYLSRVPITYDIKLHNNNLRTVHGGSVSDFRGWMKVPVFGDSNRASISKEGD